MIKFGKLLIAASLGAVLQSGATYAETLDCQTMLSEAHAAQGDVGTLTILRDETDKDCELDVAASVGRMLGFAYFNNARKAPEADRVQLLKSAAFYAKDWRILAALGAEQLRAGERADAARSLQSALIAIQAIQAELAPPARIVEKLLTMANNARAAAPNYVKAETTRSGEPGGVAADRVAGVDIEAVPFPIEFVFGETNPTEDGLYAITDLADLLKSETANRSNARVILAGHTDPVGSEAANQALSEQRAASVREALVADGALSGVEFEIVGCGETSPAKIESPEFYSEEEIHQIMRRVELIRSGSPCP